MLEDFEKRTADIEDRETVRRLVSRTLALHLTFEQIEKQRQYLGGDEDHTILVKGLDFALLEQNKAKLAASTAKDEDEFLEAVFHEIKTEPSVPKKRTREDIVRELKEKRASGSLDAPAATALDPLEKAKVVGKFKPIGAPTTSKDKGKEKEDGKRKKKKRKIVSDKSTNVEQDKTAAASSTESLKPVQPEQSSSAPAAPVVDEDFDIFGDVEEYKGLEIDDEGSGEDQEKPAKRKPITEPSTESLDAPPPPLPKKWFNDLNDESGPSVAGPSTLRSKSIEAQELEPPEKEGGEEIEGPEEPVRLAPLASSTVPSIKDLLALDAQAEAAAKRKARKEKKKNKEAGKKELSDTAKLDRDYQK